MRTRVGWSKPPAPAETTATSGRNAATSGDATNLSGRPAAITETPDTVSKTKPAASPHLRWNGIPNPPSPTLPVSPIDFRHIKPALPVSLGGLEPEARARKGGGVQEGVRSLQEFDRARSRRGDLAPLGQAVEEALG